MSDGSFLGKRNNFPQTNGMLKLLMPREPYVWLDRFGVPGKPLTTDQFFTEDVFRMRVPDDGAGSPR